MKMPVLPAHLVALELETADGLLQDDRPRDVTRPNHIAIVIIVARRYGHDACINDTDHLLRLGVPNHYETFDGMSAGIRGAASHRADDALQATALLFRCAEISR